MRNFIGIGLLGMFLLTGCVFWGDTYHKKEIAYFAFEKRDNPDLVWDVIARIDQDKKTLELWFPPSDSLDSVVPRFGAEGSEVLFDGRHLESGGASVKLTSTHTITVRSLDDTEQSYKLSVLRTAKVITDFWFSRHTYENAEILSGSYQGMEDPPYGGNAYYTPWQVSQTRKIQIYLPDLSAGTLVPTFSHNARSLRCNGVILISGVTPIDITQDQVLELVGADGSVSSIDLVYTFSSPRLSWFKLLKSDNPSLRKDYSGTIDSYTHTVAIDIPDYVDAREMVASFEIEGSHVLSSGTTVTSGVTPLDLGGPLILTVQTKSGRAQASYIVQPHSIAPSSSKSITNYSLYTRSYGLPYNPWSQAEHGGTRSQPGTDTYIFRSDTSRTHLDKTAIYLEIYTSGVQTALGSGRPLTQGSLSPSRFFPENWLDFSSPAEIIITAEDLTTRTVTLTLKAFDE